MPKAARTGGIAQDDCRGTAPGRAGFLAQVRRAAPRHAPNRRRHPARNLHPAGRHFAQRCAPQHLRHHVRRGRRRWRRQHGGRLFLHARVRYDEQHLRRRRARHRRLQPRCLQHRAGGGGQGSRRHRHRPRRRLGLYQHFHQDPAPGKFHERQRQLRLRREHLQQPRARHARRQPVGRELSRQRHGRSRQRALAGQRWCRPRLREQPKLVDRPVARPRPRHLFARLPHLPAHQAGQPARLRPPVRPARRLHFPGAGAAGGSQHVLRLHGRLRQGERRRRHAAPRARFQPDAQAQQPDPLQR